MERIVCIITTKWKEKPPQITWTTRTYDSFYGANATGSRRRHYYASFQEIKITFSNPSNEWGEHINFLWYWDLVNVIKIIFLIRITIDIVKCLFWLRSCCVCHNLLRTGLQSHKYTGLEESHFPHSFVNQKHIFNLIRFNQRLLKSIAIPIRMCYL